MNSAVMYPGESQHQMETEIREQNFCFINRESLTVTCAEHVPVDSE